MTTTQHDGRVAVYDSINQRWWIPDRSDVLRMAKDTPLRLVTGDRYDVDDLICVGWTRHNVAGYHWHDYFGPNGQYLGPKLAANGCVEPLFQRRRG